METHRTDPAATMHTILVAGTDEPLVLELAGRFEATGLPSVTSTTSEHALERARARQPVLVVADAALLDLPAGGTGTLLDALRENPYTAHIPVVAVLPPGSGEEIQLHWYGRGIAECLVRPHSQDLLAWRLRGLAQRFAPAEPARNTLEADTLVLDLQSRKATVDGAPVALTRKEFDLLNMLLRKRGTVAYTTHLYHSVWGYGDSSPVDSHTVKVHVSSLRSKLGPALGRKIVNLPGIGYRFDD